MVRELNMFTASVCVGEGVTHMHPLFFTFTTCSKTTSAVDKLDKLVCLGRVFGAVEVMFVVLSTVRRIYI